MDAVSEFLQSGDRGVIEISGYKISLREFHDGTGVWIENPDEEGMEVSGEVEERLGEMLEELFREYH